MYRIVDIDFALCIAWAIWAIHLAFKLHRLSSIVLNYTTIIVMIVLYIYIIAGRIRHNEKMKELDDLIKESTKRIFNNHLN